MPSTAVQRLSLAIAGAWNQRRAALIGYWPVGFPNVPASVAVIQAMAESGVDIIEVGLPTWEPTLDGPVIRRALDVALRNGTRTEDFFAAVSELTSAGVPAVGMAYWKTVEQYGPERLAADLAGAGGCGLIAPDMPYEAMRAWSAVSDVHNLGRIFLASHGISASRLEFIEREGGGFVYVTASQGLTGDGDIAHDRVRRLVERVRTAVGLPACAGIGVSSCAQAARVARYADGVVVGTAFVRLMAEAPDEQSGIKAVRAFAEALSLAVRAAEPRGANGRECNSSDGRARNRHGCSTPPAFGGEVRDIQS
ncbi:tryptophan synthase subunit alpha [Streptomyces prunicolor]